MRPGDVRLCETIAITLGAVPILVLDAWEHAYYLQYGPEKKRYFDAIWNVWNWDDVARRYVAARLGALQPQAEGRAADGARAPTRH